MKDFFKVSNLSYLAQSVFKARYLIAVFVFFVVIASALFFIGSVRFFPESVSHTVSKGQIEVEIQSTHFTGSNKFRTGYWVGVGKTVEGEVWPLIRTYDKPYVVGSTITVELKCTEGKLPHCQGYDVKAPKLLID